MDRNIFEAAAKQAQKSPSSSTKAPPQPSTPASPKMLPISQYDGQDPEITEMLSRMRQMHDQFESELEEVRKKGAENRIDIDHYLDAFNLDPVSREKSQQSHRQFEAQIDNLLTGVAGVKKQAKSHTKLTQERKNKSLGSRKKWIPMK